MTEKLFDHLRTARKSQGQRIAVIAGNKEQYHKFIDRFDLSPRQFMYVYRKDQIRGMRGSYYILIGSYFKNEVYYDQTELVKVQQMKELVL